jgi:predicted TIM-barrel fold metal-dependent hydrolase
VERSFRQRDGGLAQVTDIQLILRTAAWLTLAAAAPAVAGAPAPPEAQVTRPLDVVVPLVDHHKHLISREAARGEFPSLSKEIALPKAFTDLLAQRQAAWNDPSRLLSLYDQSAIVLNTENEDLPSWVRGRKQVSEYVGTLFGQVHRIKPVAYRLEGSRGYIAGYLYRPEVDRHFGHVLLSLVQGTDGRWLIDAETPTFPGPRVGQEVDAKDIVKQLDDAGIRKAVALSAAYWFGSEFRNLGGGEREYALVRAENDWAAEQVAQHTDRLVGVCSVNPLRSYAVREVHRCGQQKLFRAVKLHHGNSRVDLRNAEHAKAVGEVFAEANRQKLGLVVHLWNDPIFEAEGAEHAQVFLDQVLPNAPDVVVHVAHMAGGGRATQTALRVFADAIAARDPRTRNLYFDVASLVDGETLPNLHLDVERMRQIGLDRILFGSEAFTKSLNGWASLHMLPLTQQEFRIIANNVVPYAR